MGNIFQEKSKLPETHDIFSWEGLGDIEKGRENLGKEMPVVVYRLLEFTMLDVLVKEFGEEKAHELFRKAGFMAGKELAENTLDLKADFDSYVSELQKTLKDLKIGILRVESFDSKTGSLVLTVGEDLDCSGLPSTNEVICHYDEGFIAGLLFAYTKQQYHVEEVDCWAKGDRVCRFAGQVIATPEK